MGGPGLVTISIHILFRGVVKGANFWNSEIKCVFNKRTIKALEICIQILIFKFTPFKAGFFYHFCENSRRKKLKAFWGLKFNEAVAISHFTKKNSTSRE